MLIQYLTYKILPTKEETPFSPSGHFSRMANDAYENYPVKLPLPGTEPTTVARAEKAQRLLNEGHILLAAVVPVKCPEGQTPEGLVGKLKELGYVIYEKWTSERVHFFPIWLNKNSTYDAATSYNLPEKSTKGARNMLIFPPPGDSVWGRDVLSVVDPAVSILFNSTWVALDKEKYSKHTLEATVERYRTQSTDAPEHRPTYSEQPSEGFDCQSGMFSIWQDAFGEDISLLLKHEMPGEVSFTPNVQHKLP